MVAELGRGGPGAAPLRFVCPGRRGGQMGGQSTATDLGSVVVLVPKAPELPGATVPQRRGVLWFLGAAPGFTDRCTSWLHPCQQTAQTCTECDKESESAVGRTRKGGWDLPCLGQRGRPLGRHGVQGRPRGSWAPRPGLAAWARALAGWIHLPTSLFRSKFVVDPDAQTSMPVPSRPIELCGAPAAEGRGSVYSLP